MDQNKNALERAFEMARSGKYNSTTEIKQRLATEGYSLKDFVGPALARQLRQIIKSEKAPSADS